MSDQLPPYLPPSVTGPPGPPMGTSGLFAAGAPTFGQEVVALGFLVLMGFLLPPPWGIRFALLVLLAYLVSTEKHRQDLNGIIEFFSQGLHLASSAGG